MCYCASSYVGSQDSNLGPHARTARALSTEPSPQLSRAGRRSQNLRAVK